MNSCYKSYFAKTFLKKRYINLILNKCLWVQLESYNRNKWNFAVPELPPLTNFGNKKRYGVCIWKKGRVGRNIPLFNILKMYSTSTKIFTCIFQVNIVKGNMKVSSWWSRWPWKTFVSSLYITSPFTLYFVCVTMCWYCDDSEWWHLK